MSLLQCRYEFWSLPNAANRLFDVLQSLARSLWHEATKRKLKMGAYPKLSTAIVVAGLCLTACTSGSNVEAEVAKTVVDDFWRAIRDQDVELLSRVVATDDELIVFGTDAQERWVGSSAFLSAEEQMMQAFDVESLDRREETLQIHSRGGVAWFSTVFDIKISVDGELASLEGLRTTGVIEKRDDDWVIVQAHTSVPISGQQVEY